MARNTRLDYSCKHVATLSNDEDKNKIVIGEILADLAHWKGKIVAKNTAYGTPRLVGVISDITGVIKDNIFRPVAEVKWFNDPKKSKSKAKLKLSTIYDVRAFVRSGCYSYWGSPDDSKLLKIVDDYYNGV
jgi:hypothetical protein